MKKFDLNGDYYDLCFKDVRVISVKGEVYEGNVSVTFYDYENESGEDSFVIMLDEEGRSIELERPEIVSIEILE